MWNSINIGRLLVVKDATRTSRGAERRITPQRGEKEPRQKMQHDERLARRAHAAVDRKRLRANAEDERDAVRPRAMQQDDVEDTQSSGELGQHISADSLWFLNFTLSKNQR